MERMKPTETLAEFLADAYRIGESLDLAKAHYGPHSRTKRYYETTKYYPLLAGLARKIGARYAVDVGTHYGGSAMALKLGMGLGQGLVVTVDVTRRNQEFLARYPRIHRVKGSSINPVVTAEVIGALGGNKLDILYIDSVHNYEHTMKNVEIYGALNPDFIVFDDIKINAEMKRAWAELSESYKAFDATVLCTRNCGFGVLDMRKG
jgi:cephalosporin hydroxylase